MIIRLAFVLTLFFLPLSVRAQELGIAAVVNEDAISMADVTDRMKLIMISSGLPNTPETREKVLPQIINGLIEEQIKLQEAARNKLTIDEEDVLKGFDTLAGQNNLTREQFFQAMQQSGIPKRTIEHQIRAQLAWTKVIQSLLRPRVDVTETDIDARLQRMKAQLGKTEYAVSQIYLPVAEGDNEADIRALAQRLVAEMKKGAPFAAVATQFSKAPGAQNGGALGWVREGDLPPDLDQVITTMDEESLSDPIRATDGYHILWLKGKRTLSEDKIPPRDDIANMIGLERLDREQQRHLSDLKTSAFIERRV